MREGGLVLIILGMIVALAFGLGVWLGGEYTEASFKKAGCEWAIVKGEDNG